MLFLFDPRPAQLLDTASIMVTGTPQVMKAQADEDGLAKGDIGIEPGRRDAQQALQAGCAYERL